MRQIRTKIPCAVSFRDTKAPKRNDNPGFRKAIILHPGGKMLLKSFTDSAYSFGHIKLTIIFLSCSI